MSGLTNSKAWRALLNHLCDLKEKKITDLFSDKSRFSKFSAKLDDLIFDYSKNLITEKTLQLLFELASQQGVQTRIKEMFDGKKINLTENRAVLHVACRNFSDMQFKTDGEDVMPFVLSVRRKMAELSEQVRDGTWTGHTKKRVKNVVSIGIGGSSLGPRLAVSALKSYRGGGPCVSFVSNVDPVHLADTLDGLNPETTLFVIASKTFTTTETLKNATAARNWIIDSMGAKDAVTSHFIAVTNNTTAAAEFGISADNTVPMRDWIGGRFSLWSATGLPVAISTGMDNFTDLLKGAHEADRHFYNSPAQKNIPILMALTGIWNHNFLGASSVAVIPYSQRLSLFPSYLQQLSMESNGKGVSLDGNKIDNYTTGPVVWGEKGTDAQHSFFQLLHQGTQMVPVDFIAPVTSDNPINNMHKTLLANLIAQGESLMKGKSTDEVKLELSEKNTDPDIINKIAPHKRFEGNRPSNTILFKELNPFSLGRLLALYEHMVFVQGIIWNTGSFDQWGVELGKQLAGTIFKDLLENKCEISRHDSSTSGLIEYIRKNLRE